MTRVPPRLVAIAGPLAGSSLPLARQNMSVGRDESNDLVIADVSVSPRHCVLTCADGRVTVVDCDR